MLVLGGKITNQSKTGIEWAESFYEGIFILNKNFFEAKIAIFDDVF